MVATYSVIECNISIVCCCMPAMLSLLRRFFPDVFGSTNKSKQYDPNSESHPVTIGRIRANKGIQKTTMYSVAHEPREDDSDIELVETNARS